MSFILLESGGFILLEDGVFHFLLDESWTAAPFGQAVTYSETPDSNFVEFQPEVGPPKRRRHFSSSSDTISFSLIMSPAQYTDFLDFYRTTTKDGTLSFTFPRPRTGTTETWIFSGVPVMKYRDYGLYEVSLTMKNVP